VATCVVAGCGKREATPANEIAYTVNHDGSSEIWVLDSKSGATTRLAHAEATSPDWSPTKESVVFSGGEPRSNGDPGEPDLFVLDANGDDLRQLTDDEVADSTPAWSPDGEQIAFAHTPGLGTEEADGVIVVLGVRDGARAQVTRHGESAAIVYDSNPSWSPDGSRIAFTRTTIRAGKSPRNDVYAIEASGTGERLLAEDAADPEWSPDGERIVFVRMRDVFGRTCFAECAPNGELFVALADGSEPRRVTRNRADDQSPSWSPDGRSIVFASDRSNPPAHEYELYVLSVATSQTRRVTTNDVWDLEPSWR
jgi:TolB protein